MCNRIFFYFLSCLLFYSCTYSAKRETTTKNSFNKGQLSSDGFQNTNQPATLNKAVNKNYKPVFGYRFQISGDFDGDGKKEKLTENYYSKLTNKETNKFYDSLPDYDELVRLATEKEPFSFISCDNKYVDTLQISSNAQLLGLSYLKNEGDLDGDGADEISYVVNWADWSNLNTWHIMSFKNKKWKEIYSFEIWDWQLPDLPQTYNEYGLMGLENKIINTTNDSANKIIEKDLYNFKGLVKKISNNHIHIIFKNEEAELDTAVINLATIGKKAKL